MSKKGAASAQNGSAGKGTPLVESAPLSEAQGALARGDVRRARAALAEVGPTATDDERAKARLLRRNLGLDPQALGVAFAVLALIAAAAIWALFTRRG